MNEIYWGDARVRPGDGEAGGDFVERDGETWYRISNYHRMRPFLMTVVSGFDHWMFISSNGGLTCGRRDPEHALFPYYTDDKIHDADATTGPETVLRVHGHGRTFLWKPFCRDVQVYRIERNLYRNRPGSRLIFEEVNHDLGLVYAYSWSTGDRFGFIRRSTITNLGDAAAEIEVLDGFRNLLPAGVNQSLQTGMSTLLDAYKQAESFPDHGAALYTFSSIPSDRAEPSEALRATAAWSCGLDSPRVLLSEDQVDAFCAGLPLRTERAGKGKRGAFYAQSSLAIPAGERTSWYQAADVEQGPTEVPALLNSIREGLGADALERDVAENHARLLRLAGGADGCQLSSDRLLATRHFSNTLFNIMRGGTFYDGYRFPATDFLEFAGRWNRDARQAFAERLEPGGNTLSRADITAAAQRGGNPGLERLALEYLPLTFSRRHGDPSRPWNRFCVDTRNPDGSDRLNYEGNWRDIFQNWEALSIAYPEYIESFIARFVNASTVDGYNPYRISREGFEWEILDPDDPWSNIGYWGDHQVNYLAPFLELSQRYHPGRLGRLLKRDLFVFADVPYRLKPYREMIEDPRNSVTYDATRAAAVEARAAKTGNDGRLVTGPDGAIYRVNLLEKLLLPALVKLGNFVPAGGIWMNTQRPDWNDANNALVGYGLSMVTLCYLRRYLVCLAGLLETQETDSYPVSQEVLDFLEGLDSALRRHRDLLGGTVDPAVRRRFMDELGALAEHYREAVYSGFSGQKAVLDRHELLRFFELALDYMDHTIRLSRRDDGLFSAYRLLQFTPVGYAVEELGEMLEGQVAVLGSGLLDPRQSLELLDALQQSALYHAGRGSYLLYPDRELPRFLDKNRVPPDVVDDNRWMRAELDSGRGKYLLQDVEGNVHFSPDFRNASELRRALQGDPEVGTDDVDALCAVYETVFRHRRFTGRSGTMFKYEGLGCIYWHMVSKLALAAAEAAIAAARSDGEDLARRLFERFERIRSGLGIHYAPARYGAFPLDPYSHSPAFGGMQQPGMTGQVKEDVIMRFRQLGVRVASGRVMFDPLLLRREEFLSAPRCWRYAVGGEPACVELPAGSLGFTLCGVPVLYRLADSPGIRVRTPDGEHAIAGTQLDPAWSRALFERDGQILAIEVSVPENVLR